MISLDEKRLGSLCKQGLKAKDLSAWFRLVCKKKVLSQKDILSIDSLTDQDINTILETAWLFKHVVLGQVGKKKLDLLKGFSTINFFCEDSTRTRSSFELAGKHLGADTINISGDSSSMKKKGETLNDTARTLDQMHPDCIIVRDKHALAPAMIAREVKAPVINAGDGWHEHPTQALLDVLTMLEEFGTLKGKTMAIVGDILHSRVAGSLLRIGKRLGMKLRVVAPPTLLPVGVEKVFNARVYSAMDEGIKGVDIAYLLRIQLERAAAAYIPSVRDYSKLYCMNRARLPLLAPGAIIMHAGPINREVDLSTEVMEGKQSRVEQQVQNGLAVRMALLYILIKP